MTDKISTAELTFNSVHSAEILAFVFDVSLLSVTPIVVSGRDYCEFSSNYLRYLKQH